MKPNVFLPLILFGFVGWNTCSAEEASLRVTSTTPDVNINIRSNGAYAIKLPVLQFEFRIDAACSAGLMPESVLLSVADTRKRIAANDLDSTADGSITMRIPAKQLAPLSAEGFCVEADDGAKQEAVTVRGILSAQAALLCADETEQQVTYASRSLDVTLTCDASSKE